jgi:K+-sensing histidine kinase KdpD
LLRRAIENVVRNDESYTGENTEVEILVLREVPSLAVITVLDHGAGRLNTTIRYRER